jgi:hypothetical protein
MVKLQILVVEDVDSGKEFALSDGWFVHSVISTWEVGGRSYMKLLLEAGETA